MSDRKEEALFGALLLMSVGMAGCPQEAGGMLVGDDDAVGDDDDDAPFDEYWCCDPDEICECPGMWHCTEVDGGKLCEQENPFLPDDGGRGSWQCRYDGELMVCTGQADEHPDAGADGDWTCVDEAGTRTCTQEAGEDDFPDGEGEGPWDCAYQEGNDLRVCTSDDDGGEGEGEEGEGEEGEGEDDGGDGECVITESCEDGIDNDCNGLADCQDPGCFCGDIGEICDGLDNDGDGRADEGRACGDANEGDNPCPIGAFQICDAYCGVHRVCGPDRNWGPCLVDETCAGVPQCDEHSDCPRGQFCDYGQCTPGTFDFFPCENDGDCSDPFFGEDYACEVGQGVCIADCFHHSDCGAGLVCDLGECVEDPYQPGRCG